MDGMVQPRCSQYGEHHQHKVYPTTPPSALPTWSALLRKAAAAAEKEPETVEEVEAEAG
jgi:hypothetical protein